jgi:hypothetical protein
MVFLRLFFTKKDKREGKKKVGPMLEESRHSAQMVCMAAGAGKPRPFSGILILVEVLLS